MLQPEISIIIPSVNGWQDLEGCLHATMAQIGGIATEIIVLDRVGETVRQPLQEQYPQVRLLEAPAETSIPALRALGFQAAQAEIVGVLEDHIIVPRDWVQCMLAVHRDGGQVVGGAIDNAARERLIDWAAFLCEYHHCLAPMAGPASWVPGNNVTYRRKVLERFRDVIRRERWEDHLHEAMRRSGVRLEMRPDIRVGHKKHYTASEYVTQRYFYARSYAGMRVEEAGWMRRLAYGLAASALPPLLLSRIVTCVLKAGRHKRELVMSLPFLWLFVMAWSFGETVGYWCGAGDALKKVC